VNTAHKEIDLARPKENRKISGFLPQECEWMDRLLADGFIDTFREFEKGPEHLLLVGPAVPRGASATSAGASTTSSSART